MNNDEVIYISDAQKGLKKALTEVLPEAQAFTCQKHFGADVITICGHGASAEFLGLANATLPEEFDYLMSNASEKLQEYLKGKDK